jgi:hypothetical protein
MMIGNGMQFDRGFICAAMLELDFSVGGYYQLDVRGRPSPLAPFAVVRRYVNGYARPIQLFLATVARQPHWYGPNPVYYGCLACRPLSRGSLVPVALHSGCVLCLRYL